MKSNIKFLAASIALALCAAGPALAADNQSGSAKADAVKKSTMTKEERSAARKASRAEGRAAAKDGMKNPTNNESGKYGTADAGAKVSAADRAAARKARAEEGKAVAKDAAKNPTNNETGVKK